MRFFSRNDNPNAIIGIFLLIMLAILAGPSTLPRLFNAMPSLDEGIPCDMLRKGRDRADHQSLLARAISGRAESPISLDVRTSALPTVVDGNLEITVVVANETLAPVPLLITPSELILDPNFQQSGLGVVFNSSADIANIGENIGAGGYSEERIRILGPRQICVHRITVAFGQIPGSSALWAGNVTVRAFYRNTSAGPLLDPNRPYTDQGLWVGVVMSPSRGINAPIGQP